MLDLDDVVIDLRGRRGGLFEMPTLTVVVPTKNEAANLPHVLPHFPSWVNEVIVVDADSTDGTREVAESLIPEAIIIVESRPGKGRALRTGFEAASSDFVIAIDADGSTHPKEIPAFFGSLVAGADFVKGSRFSQGGGTDDMERHRRLGNWVLTATVNRLFGAKYTDLCYGYFGFRTEHLDRLMLVDDSCTGFEIETLLKIRALRADLLITEVASFEYDRIHGTSNLRVVRDGLRIGRVILREFAAERGLRR